jgi:hypothetical protein
MESTNEKNRRYTKSAVRHHLQINALQEDHTKIGMFTLTQQVRKLFPLIVGVMYATYYQLLPSIAASLPRFLVVKID